MLTLRIRVNRNYQSLAFRPQYPVLVKLTSAAIHIRSFRLKFRRNTTDRVHLVLNEGAAFSNVALENNVLLGEAIEVLALAFLVAVGLEGKLDWVWFLTGFIDTLDYQL